MKFSEFPLNHRLPLIQECNDWIASIPTTGIGLTHQRNLLTHIGFPKGLRNDGIYLVKFVRTETITAFISVGPNVFFTLSFRIWVCPKTMSREKTYIYIYIWFYRKSRCTVGECEGHGGSSFKDTPYWVTHIDNCPPIDAANAIIFPACRTAYKTSLVDNKVRTSETDLKSPKIYAVCNELKFNHHSGYNLIGIPRFSKL